MFKKTLIHEVEVIEDEDIKKIFPEFYKANRQQIEDGEVYVYNGKKLPACFFVDHDDGGQIYVLYYGS